MLRSSPGRSGPGSGARHHRLSAERHKIRDQPGSDLAPRPGCTQRPGAARPIRYLRPGANLSISRYPTLRAALALVFILASGCRTSTGDENDDNDPQPSDFDLRIERIASGLSGPVFLTSPAGDARLFVLEQPGRIRIIADGQLLATPFLDIVARVGSGGERGLLGLAFHPSHASNGYFFVYFTDRQGNTRIERFSVSGNPDVADAQSAQLVLAVDQPFGNHNGGQVSFGPDGKLYIALGDGGSGGDPQGHGQNRATLLGSLLRLDVDAGQPYVIPADNPFVADAGMRGEIWAYGLRNPWRFAFDRTTGRLYIADVGQNAWEEINVAPASQAGINYGWNIMEGMHCFGAGCNDDGLMLPAVEYGHADGCSVTGGYVYRGTRIPEIAGHYFYSDYCGGWLRSFRFEDGRATEPTDWQIDAGSVLSFGEDASGELYVLTANGSVYRIDRLE